MPYSKNPESVSVGADAVVSAWEGALLESSGAGSSPSGPQAESSMAVRARAGSARRIRGSDLQRAAV